MKQLKKYRVIAKVENERFVKYNCNDLLKFTQFLDRKFPDWRWFNVFDKKTKNQIANFTKNNRPYSKWVNL